jgi:hypothetical protein
VKSGCGTGNFQIIDPDHDANVGNEEIHESDPPNACGAPSYSTDCSGAVMGNNGRPADAKPYLKIKLLSGAVPANTHCSLEIQDLINPPVRVIANSPEYQFAIHCSTTTDHSVNNANFYEAGSSIEKIGNNAPILYGIQSECRSGGARAGALGTCTGNPCKACSVDGHSFYVRRTTSCPNDKSANGISNEYGGTIDRTNVRCDASFKTHSSLDIYFKTMGSGGTVWCGAFGSNFVWNTHNLGDHNIGTMDFVTHNAGIYTNVALHTTGGSGSSAVATVKTSETDVTGVTVTTDGSGYAIGDTLTISGNDIGRSADLVFTLVSDDLNSNALNTDPNALLPSSNAKTSLISRNYITVDATSIEFDHSVSLNSLSPDTHYVIHCQTDEEQSAAMDAWTDSNPYVFDDSLVRSVTSHGSVVGTLTLTFTHGNAIEQGSVVKITTLDSPANDIFAAAATSACTGTTGGRKGARTALTFLSQTAIANSDADGFDVYKLTTTSDAAGTSAAGNTVIIRCNTNLENPTTSVTTRYHLEVTYHATLRNRKGPTFRL